MKNKFTEVIIKEYPPIVKRKSFKKDITYRIRIVKREFDGIPKVVLDIRKYLVTEKIAIFSEEGIWLTKEETENLYNLLPDIIKNFYPKKERGSGTRNRTKDNFHPKKETELF